MPPLRAHSELLERRRLLSLEPSPESYSIDADSELVLQSVGAGAAFGVSPVLVYSDRDAGTGKGKDVYFRRYTAAGIALGAGSIVNTTTSGAQMNPHVAVSANGSFVVVWQSEGQDGDSWGIYARRFNSSGMAQGGEILVNTSTAGAQTAPRAAIDSSGNFVVAYVNEASGNGEVLVRRFQADGTPIAQVTASGVTTKAYSAPTIAMKGDGTFAVAWVMTNLDTDNSTDVQVRIYSASGVASGSTQTIDDAGDQATPALGAGGRFVLAWADASTSESTILYRTIDNAGAWVSSVAMANQDQGIGNRIKPSVDVDPSGNAIIGWTQQDPETFYSSTVIRLFDINDNATSSEATTTDGSSARTLMSVIFSAQGTVFEISTVGEFLGYGIGTFWPRTSSITHHGLGATNDVFVAYDVNSTTLRASFNGVTQDYVKSAYARIHLELGDGNDSVFGTDASLMFTVSGGAGSDSIFTGSGYDSISGGDGHDSITTGDGSDYAIGNSGNDTLFGLGGDDTLTGGSGKDLMYGGDGNDRVAGTGSPDQIFGEGGDDRLYGDDGDDWLDGGGGKDRVYGGENNDYLVGGSSNDRLYGQNGNDTLGGGKGNDYLAGDAGIDTVLGKEPGDTVFEVEVIA